VRQNLRWINAQAARQDSKHWWTLIPRINAVRAVTATTGILLRRDTYALRGTLHERGGL